MDVAKTLINQLDRVQKQVLIEAMIIDVALGDGKSFGASIRQAQQEIGGNAVGGGLSTAIASALGPGQRAAAPCFGAPLIVRGARKAGVDGRRKPSPHIAAVEE